MDNQFHPDVLQAQLNRLAMQARRNSERWFPEVHGQGEDIVRIHYTLGLNGEAGEVSNLIKKVHTGKRSISDAKTDIAHELADVFTYLVMLAESLNISLTTAFLEKQQICEERWSNG